MARLPSTGEVRTVPIPGTSRLPRQTIAVQALRNARRVEVIAHGRNQSLPAIRFTTHCPAGLAACVLASIPTRGAAAQTGATMIAIEKMAVGAGPPNSSLRERAKGSPGQWVVVEDPTCERLHAPSSNPAQTGPTIVFLWRSISRSREKRRGHAAFQADRRQGRSGRRHRGARHLAE